MEQSVAVRGDGEELIDTKVVGAHLTDSRVRPPNFPIIPLA